MLVKIQGEWIVHSFLSSSQNSRSYLKRSFIMKVKNYYHYHIRDYKLSESFHARVRYVICQLFQYKCRPLSLGNVTKRTVIRRTSFYTDVFIDFIKYHLCWSFHNLLCRLGSGKQWAGSASGGSLEQTPPSCHQTAKPSAFHSQSTTNGLGCKF